MLVVDDDPIALRVTRARLESMGFEVMTRGRALGTSNFIRSEAPDVVLMDVEMPALSGDSLAQLIEKNSNVRRVFVVLHSSHELEQLQELAKGCGAVGVIRKTSENDTFRAEFERVFAVVEPQLAVDGAGA